MLGHTVCIHRPRAELYAFWRDFSHFPAFMENVQSVTVQSPTRSHWVIAAPAGRSVEWDSEITEDIADERIAWTSLEGADVRNSGAVEFRDSPTGRGTFVTVTIAYDPPAGELGRLIAKLFHREPKIQARQDLRRFKQLMETGEIPIATPPLAAPRA
ncbi:MAG: SRPBCC family protein [Gammaproteobacteria bacterium]|nr:SRPBCC family protein [Gammaproteobacteria bacterium]